MPLRLTRKMIQPGNRRTGRRARSLPAPATVQENTTLPVQPAHIWRAVIDALPASIALLDADGMIVMVNNAWCCFANANALRSADFGVGMNYLRVCEMAEEAVELALGIRRVLSRTTPLLSVEYPCHSPTCERWFELIVAPLDDVKLPGAMLSHVNITLRKLAERNMVAGAMRLADAQRIARMGSWEFDLLTMRGMLSDEMCRLSYCHAFGEVLDCNDFLALAHPEDRAPLARALIPAPDAPPQVSLEYRTHPAMGRMRLLSAIIQTVRGANGQVRHIRGTAQDISERQRADEALRASEQRFSTAFHQAPIGMALVAPDGGYLKVNHALCEMLGYPESILLAKTFEDVTHPDDLAVGRPLVRDMIAGHCDTFQLEKRYVCADGSIITALVNVALVRDRDGQALYQIAHVQDWSARKQAELDIREALERLSEAQRIGQIGDWGFELASQAISWSPEVYRILGRDPALGPPRDYADNATVFDEASQARMTEKIALVIATGSKQEYELLAKRGDGEQVWLQVFVVPTCDSSGKVCRLRGTVQDISQRKRGQLVSARMAAIVESSEDAIVSMDMNGLITSWNASAERIFGYTAQEMLGQSILRVIPVEHREEEAKNRQRVQQGQRIHHFETTRVSRHGQLIDVSSSISPIKDERGNIVGASRILRDISERRQMNVKLQRDAERLQHLSRRLMATEEEERRRLGRELHDQIGSNLTAITLGLQVLRAKLPPAVAAEMIPRIADLESLLRETFLHIRDVLSNLRPPAIDEFGVLAALRYYVRGLATRSSLKLEIVGQEPSPRLSPEVEIALFRIAQEALTNVLKYAHAACVIISLESDSTGVRFLIRDDGCGFDCNRNLSAMSSLGMATMQERAQAIGAQLRLCSAIGGGTQISVELAPGATRQASAILKGGA